MIGLVKWREGLVLKGRHERLCGVLKRKREIQTLPVGEEEERKQAADRHTRTTLALDMFTSQGLFRDVPCPSGCNPSFCQFSHQSIPAKRPQISRPSPPPRQTPSSSRQPSSSPENAERPTKLQRAGSVKKPVAVPTASSSSTVSLAVTLHRSRALTSVGSLDWCSYPHDQCGSVKDTHSYSSGVSLLCLSITFFF